MNVDDDQLDDLLRRHLSLRLDAHAGRAEANLLRAVARRRWRLAAGGLAAAIAAAIALLAVLNRPIAPPPIARDTTTRQAPADAAPPVERTLVWRTIDDGLVTLDDQTAARRLRRQEMRTVRWFDPRDQAVIQVTIPRERVVFVGMDKQ